MGVLLVWYLVIMGAGIALQLGACVATLIVTSMLRGFVNPPIADPNGTATTEAFGSINDKEVRKDDARSKKTIVGGFPWQLQRHHDAHFVVTILSLVALAVDVVYVLAMVDGSPQTDLACSPYFGSSPVYNYSSYFNVTTNTTTTITTLVGYVAQTGYDSFLDEEVYCSETYEWGAHMILLGLAILVPWLAYPLATAPFLAAGGFHDAEKQPAIAEPTNFAEQRHRLFWSSLRTKLRATFYTALVGAALPLASEIARLVLMLRFDDEQLSFSTKEGALTTIVHFATHLAIAVLMAIGWCMLIGGQWLVVGKVLSIFAKMSQELPKLSPMDPSGEAEKDKQARKAYSDSDALTVEFELLPSVVRREMQQKGAYIPRSVIKTLWRRWRGPFMLLASMRLVQEALGLIPALLLKELVDGVVDASDAPEREGVLEFNVRHGASVIFGLVACSLVSTFIRTHYDLKHSKIGLYCRAMLSDAVYTHAAGLKPFQRLKKSTRSSTTAGGPEYIKDADVINHLLVDVPRICDQVSNLNNIWCLPCQVGFALYLLYLQIGWGFLAGLFLTIAMVPTNALLAKKIGSINVAMMKANDARVGAITEVVSNIKFVKMCGWSDAIFQRVAVPRAAFMVCLSWVKYLDGICAFFWATTPVLVSLASFITYAGLFHGVLTPGKVIASLSLFNTLILPLNSYPWVLNGAVEAWVSLCRLDDFLYDYQPKEDSLPSQHLSSNRAPAKPIVITNMRVKRGQLAEDKDADSNDEKKEGDDTKGNAGKPRDIEQNTPFEAVVPSLVLVPGALTVISGPAGCGKSTVMAGLSQEAAAYDNSIPHSSVPITSALPTSISIAYLPQEAFIMDTSVRSNIIFNQSLAVAREVATAMLDVYNAQSLAERGAGAVAVANALMDRPRYEQILAATCLDGDIAQWSAGDLRRAGDRGDGLSGGQKHRVALARALYADADVYLIDDFLGALDGPVCSAVINNAIRPLLEANKYVLMASDNPEVLALALSSGGRVHRMVDGILSVAEMKGSDAPAKPPAPIAKIFGNINSPLPAIVTTLATMAREAAALRQEKNIQPMPTAMEASPDSPATDLWCEQLNEAPAVLGEGQFNTEGETLPSGESTEPSSDKKKEEEADQEIKESGSIKPSVFLSYILAMGVPLFIFVLGFLIAMQGARNYSDVYVAMWSADNTNTNDNGETTQDAQHVNELIKVLGILAAVNVVLAMVRGLSFAFAGLRACVVIHDDVVKRVIGAPFSFFSSIPRGRLINRLSRDVYCVDESLPFMFNIFLAQLFLFIGAVVVIGVTSSFAVLGGAVPICLILYGIQRPYRRANREIKRLESAARSPIVDHLGTLLEGGTIMRCLGPDCPRYFVRKALSDYSIWHKLNYNLSLLQWWFNLNMQLIGVGIIALVGIVTLVVNRNGSSSQATSMGLALAYVAPLTNYISNLLGSFTELEKLFISAERVEEYRAIETELHTFDDTVKDMRRLKGLPTKLTTAHTNERKPLLSGRGNQDGYSSAVESRQPRASGNMSVSARSLSTVAANEEHGHHHGPYTPLHPLQVIPKSDKDYTALKAEWEASWPLTGAIGFRNLSVRYTTNGPLVLRNLTKVIEDGEKVALVGRTGSGKSTLVMTLLGLVRFAKTAEGAHYDADIDGDDHIQDYAVLPSRLSALDATARAGEPLISMGNVSTAIMDPDWLRRHIVVLPQECLVLEGTILSNLDMFGTAGKEEELPDGATAVSVQHQRITSSQYHKALMRTILKVLGLERFPLTHKVEVGGSNLSAGERHLLSIARVVLECFVVTGLPGEEMTAALLPEGEKTADVTAAGHFISLRKAKKKNKCRIVIIDEPAASLDASSEERLWELVRDCFAESTVLAVTHKLKGVLGGFFGRAMVMSQGSIIADGDPQDLHRRGVGPFAAATMEREV